MESIFQSKEWEEFKLKTGYRKSYWLDQVLVMQKNLPMGRSMLYSPMVTTGQQSTVISQQFIDKIKEIAKENNTIFYRLELDIPIPNTKYQIPNTGFGFAKAFEQMQPEHSWILDLNKTEDELLAGMSMRCRYNVRLAQKSGVNIQSSANDAKMLDNFYKMYSSTGKRHGISFRNLKYFEILLEILGKGGYAQIYNASKEQEGKDIQLAAGIVVYSGPKAIYMFGASSDEMRNLKAPNLLVWQMILDAKAKGCTEFDFFGIAPDDDPIHPWAGITSFKKQFGGQKYDILGSFDLIFKPAEYRVFKVAEKIRR
jgi:lipid II:glycine glycyltransferase (peptidoglycan interpeptide bridge formation enzyme)